MNPTQSSILVLCVLLVAILAVAVLQGGSEQLFGRCLGHEEKQHLSPNGVNAIEIRQRKCPSQTSTIETSFVSRRDEEQSQYLFSIPSFIVTGPRSSRSTAVVVHWRSEDEVILLVPEPILVDIIEQLEAFSFTNANTIVLEGAQVTLVPVRPNKGFNRTPESSRAAKPDGLGGGAG